MSKKPQSKLKPHCLDTLTGGQSNPNMCLSEEDHSHYLRLARVMDDERLQELDRKYQSESRNTVDFELHNIVLWEIARRHNQRLKQLKRSLWLSSRHGRCVDAVKRWLVRNRLWSSARRRVVEPESQSFWDRNRWWLIPLLVLMSPLILLQLLAQSLAKCFSGLATQRRRQIRRFKRLLEFLARSCCKLAAHHRSRKGLTASVTATSARR